MCSIGVGVSTSVELLLQALRQPLILCAVVELCVEERTGTQIANYGERLENTLQSCRVLIRVIKAGTVLQLNPFSHLLKGLHRATLSEAAAAATAAAAAEPCS